MTGAPRTRRLALPSLPGQLPVLTLAPTELVRISRYDSGEPHFGRTGGNTEQAVVLFDRAASRIRMTQMIPLPSCPGFAQAARMLGIRSA